MTIRRHFTITGCGSSHGVPRADGNWGSCDPFNEKNKRSRASLLVEQITDVGKTVLVIDTGPDFRSQMINAGISNIDAIFYTHEHSDHTSGIDDLRCFVLAHSKTMNIYAHHDCLENLYERFAYCFKDKKQGGYIPLLNAHEISQDLCPVTITGAGGNILVEPFWQQHGTIQTLGYRIGNVAYCTDVHDFPEETYLKLQGLDMLIIDALQCKAHTSHFSLEKALEWIEKLAPKRAILTHMHIFMDYETVNKNTPDHVEPAFDGLSFTYEIP